MMENRTWLLRIRIKRGVNLAIRDVRSSDPYVVVRMGTQTLKTRTIYGNPNPEWNDDLTLQITDPNLPIILVVYDHDTLTRDDEMGDAEIEMEQFVDALRMRLDDLPNETVITKIQPSPKNCLTDESCITWIDGKVVQDLFLRLRNVECGELEIQLACANFSGSNAS